ncbi:MAG: hypothetical protein ACJ8AP_00785 [Gemmatimonadales bacterium]
MRKSWARLTGLVWLASCQGAGSSDPLRLGIELVGANTRLTLLAAPGLKLNARLKPALELPDGRVIRFDSPQLTADSAYFADPPTAIAAGRQARWRGKLRASVCDAGERVCRSVSLDL